MLGQELHGEACRVYLQLAGKLLKNLDAAGARSLQERSPTAGAFAMHIPSSTDPFAMLGANKSSQASGAASFFTPPGQTKSATRKEFDGVTNKTPAQQML